MSRKLGVPRHGRVTDEGIARITAAVSLGVSYSVAAQAAGVGVGALQDWKQRGEKARAAHRRNKYVDFLEELEKAEAVCELGLIAGIRQIGEGKSAGVWSALAFILSRRFPDRWGSKAELNIKQEVALKAYATVVSPDVWDEVEEATGEKIENRKVLDGENLMQFIDRLPAPIRGDKE